MISSIVAVFAAEYAFISDHSWEKLAVIDKYKKRIPRGESILNS